MGLMDCLAYHPKHWLSSAGLLEGTIQQLKQFNYFRAPSARQPSEKVRLTLDGIGWKVDSLSTLHQHNSGVQTKLTCTLLQYLNQGDDIQGYAI